MSTFDQTRLGSRTGVTTRSRSPPLSRSRSPVNQATMSRHSRYMPVDALTLTSLSSQQDYDARRRPRYVTPLPYHRPIQ